MQTTTTRKKTTTEKLLLHNIPGPGAFGANQQRKRASKKRRDKEGREARSGKGAANGSTVSVASAFLAAEWVGGGRPHLLHKNSPSSIDYCLCAGTMNRMGQRALEALVAGNLVTIHPNPGPPRHRTPESKAARMERRRDRRKEKRAERET